MSLELNPFIMLNGNAQEAIHFYEQALAAKVLFKQMMGEGPEAANFPTVDLINRVAHSVLKVGKSEFMVSDTLPGQPHHKGDQVNICITADDKEQAAQIYEALRLGGEVKLPLQETYFSPAYGMLIDKFGVCFQVFTKRQ